MTYIVPPLPNLESGPLWQAWKRAVSMIRCPRTFQATQSTGLTLNPTTNTLVTEVPISLAKSLGGSSSLLFDGTYTFTANTAGVTVTLNSFGLAIPSLASTASATLLTLELKVLLSQLDSSNYSYRIMKCYYFWTEVAGSTPVNPRSYLASGLVAASSTPIQFISSSSSTTVDGALVILYPQPK